MFSVHILISLTQGEYIFDFAVVIMGVRLTILPTCLFAHWIGLSRDRLPLKGGDNLLDFSLNITTIRFLF